MLHSIASVLLSAENFRPELRVLLACCKGTIINKHQNRIKFPRELQSSEFLSYAHRHGLLLVVHRFLSSDNGLSLEFRELLRREATGIFAENLRQVHGFKIAADALNRSEIPWLCVKGPVSAVTCYTDPLLRSFSDIDLIIRTEDFHHAYASLVDIGFRPYLDVMPKWQAYSFLIQSQITLIRAGSMIDLHCELVPTRYSFALKMNAIWERAERTNIFDVSAHTPSAYDTFIYLCLHAAKHDWDRLVWLLDIAGLILNDRLDWDLVINDLERTSRKIPLQVCLLLLDALLGIDLPRKISNRLRVDPLIVELCNERIMRWQYQPDEISPPWPWRSLYYRSMSERRDRWCQWHDVLLRPTSLEWQMVPLSFTFRSAYYLIRPLRLLWKHWIKRLAHRGQCLVSATRQGRGVKFP
jgi:Uncharacterised nucleotidyltransferase